MALWHMLQCMSQKLAHSRKLANAPRHGPVHTSIDSGHEINQLAQYRMVPLLTHATLRSRSVYFSEPILYCPSILRSTSASATIY